MSEKAFCMREKIADAEGKNDVRPERRNAGAPRNRPRPLNASYQLLSSPRGLSRIPFG